MASHISARDCGEPRIECPWHAPWHRDDGGQSTQRCGLVLRSHTRDGAVLPTACLAIHGHEVPRDAGSGMPHVAVEALGGVEDRDLRETAARACQHKQKKPQHIRAHVGNDSDDNKSTARSQRKKKSRRKLCAQSHHQTFRAVRGNCTRIQNEIQQWLRSQPCNVRAIRAVPEQASPRKHLHVRWKCSVVAAPDTTRCTAAARSYRTWAWRGHSAASSP